MPDLMLEYTNNKNLTAMNKNPIKYLIIIAIFVSNTLSAQETITRKLAEFYSLNAVGNLRVEIFPSDQAYAEIYYSGTTPEKVITEIKDFELSIRLSTDTPKDASIRIVLYYVKLHKISASANAGIISNEILKGDEVEFLALRGGKIDLVLELNSLNADLKQGGNISFKGRVQKQNVTASTGATYQAYELEADDSYAKSSSGAIVKVVARRIMDATANTKGFIGYKGDPVNSSVKTNFGGEIANFKDKVE